MASAYSNTRIETFETCPRQYKFQHIEKAAVEKPVSVEAFLGNAVHRTLERLYTFKSNGRLQPAAEMLEFYRNYWEGPDKERIKVTREQMGVDDYIKIGSEALAKYYDQYAPFDDAVTLALEKNISFPLDLEGRFQINGKIDRLAKRPDGTVEIIDYKTNATLPTQQNLDNDAQMGLYLLGVKHLWPDFEKVELRQIFLRHGIALSTIMNDDKAEEIRYATFQKILEIEEARREDRFPPRESAICSWCVYFELCPAKRHRLALEKDIGVEFDQKMGEELAEKYLKLNHQKKLLDSELKALKEDIIKYCETVDLTRLDSREGHLRLYLSEGDSFPTKTDDENAYMEISLLAREAGLDECFKLDPKILYDDFYKRQRLPEDLMARLEKFVRRKRRQEIRTGYRED